MHARWTLTPVLAALCAAPLNGAETVRIAVLKEGTIFWLQ